MSRMWIVVGDITSSGGRVITGSAETDIDGKGVARVNDKATCPLHKGVFPIVDGDPTITIDGQPVALHGSKLACGCTVLTVQQSHVLIKSGGATAASAGGSSSAAPSTSPSGQMTHSPAQPSHPGATPAAPPAQQGTITSRTVATSPANLARTRVGVGEEVVLSVSPGPATWSISAGGSFKQPPGSSAQATFVAGDVAASVTITATTASGVYTIVFVVVEPTNWTMKPVPGIPKKHTQGRPDCGFAGQMFVMPADVNFYNVETRELDSQCVATGSYASNNGVVHGQYPPPDHASPWFGLPQHSPTDGSTDPTGMDAIYSGYPGGAAVGTQPPFSPGAMHFDIVMQWRVLGSTSPPKNFAPQRQEHEILSSGQCVTKKGGHTESFMYSDPSTHATW